MNIYATAEAESGGGSGWRTGMLVHSIFYEAYIGILRTLSQALQARVYFQQNGFLSACILELELHSEILEADFQLERCLLESSKLPRKHYDAALRVALLRLGGDVRFRVFLVASIHRVADLCKSVG